MGVTTEHIENIIADAAENWGGDIDTAIAAHLYGPLVVKRCGSKVPGYADKKQIAGIKGQITKHLKAAQAPKRAKTAAKKK